jgi:hypothetical protein
MTNDSKRDRLNDAARHTLRDAGINEAEWARTHFTDGEWHGDKCGCPDDRCIGYHHDDPNDCGCLPALLRRPEPSPMGMYSALGDPLDYPDYE